MTKKDKTSFRHGKFFVGDIFTVLSWLLKCVKQPETNVVSLTQQSTFFCKIRVDFSSDWKSRFRIIYLWMHTLYIKYFLTVNSFCFCNLSQNFSSSSTKTTRWSSDVAPQISWRVAFINTVISLVASFSFNR